MVAGEKLPSVVDGEDARIRIDVLIAGHWARGGRGEQQRYNENPRLPFEFPNGTFSTGFSTASLGACTTHTFAP